MNFQSTSVEKLWTTDLRFREPVEKFRVHMTGSEWFSSRPGGLNRYFEDLFAALLIRDDVEVTAAAFGDAPQLANTWGPVERGTLQRVAAASSVRSYPSPGIVDRHFCLYGGAVRGRSGQRLVVHFHGPWASESLLAGDAEWRIRVKHHIERARYRQAQAFIVLSRQFRELLVSDYRVDDSSVIVVPPGVDLIRFRLAPELDSRMVVCVRRLERRMGIDYLLRAWPEILGEVPDALLTIVGTGSYEHELREMARGMRLGGSVHFLGRVGDEELSALYSASAISVVPSVALEGFGLIALESLAMGRSPIVTDCGGLPDAVQDLDGSLIVAPRNVSQLAERIVKALGGDRPTAEQCRAHAEKFSWKATAGRHVDLYRRVLS